MRGGEERKNRKSIASPRLAFFFSIVIIVVFIVPSKSFWRHIGCVSTAATSNVTAIAVAVAIVVVVVVIIVVAIIETARIISGSIIIAAVVIETVILILVIVVCFCEVSRGVAPVDGEWSKWRDGRRRDAVMPSRNAARGSRPRATLGYGGHLRGLPELSPLFVVEVAAVRLGEARHCQHSLAGHAIRTGRKTGGGSREEATSGSRLCELEWRGKKKARNKRRRGGIASARMGRAAVAPSTTTIIVHCDATGLGA